jgi:hypothetical protein
MAIGSAKLPADAAAVASTRRASVGVAMCLGGSAALPRSASSAEEPCSERVAAVAATS